MDLSSYGSFTSFQFLIRFIVGDAFNPISTTPQISESDQVVDKKVRYSSVPVYYRPIQPLGHIMCLISPELWTHEKAPSYIICHYNSFLQRSEPENAV